MLQDNDSQQYFCRNVPRRKVTSSKEVLCWAINIAEEFVTSEVRLSCPLVTTRAQLPVADDLLTGGEDFLLGKDLAGKSLWVPIAIVLGLVRSCFGRRGLTLPVLSPSRRPEG